MLRNNADLRTLAYLAAMLGVLRWQWLLPAVNPALYALSIFLGVAAAVIAHNHNHLGIFKSRKLNAMTDHWITFFYGFPTVGWIPTHNMNHHKLNNREGDYTRTWRYSEDNNLRTLLVYPSISSRFQLPEIKTYIAQTWAKDRKRAAHYLSQFVVLIALLATALAVDWYKTLLFIIIPQQVAMFSVLVFNYVQHVHCDELSEWDHSRNFVGAGLNVLLFNNGFHTIHHMKPGLHWSRSPAAHAKIAENIREDLQLPTFWGWMVRTYLLSPFVPRWRSHSLRLDRLAREEAAAAAEAATSTSSAAGRALAA